jgi:hypothetical protein
MKIDDIKKNMKKFRNCEKEVFDFLSLNILHQNLQNYTIV